MERKKLKDTDYHETRADIASQGIRGLLLINGGGAVALLAFLQAIWEERSASRELVQALLVSLAVLAGGVAQGALVNFLRYHTSIAYRQDSPSKKCLERASFLAQYLSLLAFCVALVFVVVGAYRAIN